MIEMTIDEAIKHCWDITAIACKRCADEHAQLAAWLEELKEYQSIGTPEQCQEAVEKQTGKKPTAVLGIFGGTENECKNCGNDVRYRDEYCRWCGQKLDWSDGE